MKRKFKTHIKSILILTVLGFISLSSSAQLPIDYLTKVSYHEKKEVNFGIENEASLSCLNLSELAEYHDYMQFYTMDEYVDMEGDLITDQKVIEEYHVRDDWMEGYSRITVGKEMVEVFGTEGDIIHNQPREFDPEEVYLTPLEAANYGYLNLDLAHYNEAVVDLVEFGLNVTQNNEVVTGSNNLLSITYDHNVKVASTVEYDSFGLKTRESVVEYGLTYQGDTYFPKTTTIIEWFLGVNGCCIRKTTVFNRFEYEREAMPGNGEFKSSSKLKNPFKETGDYEILLELNTNGFRIDSKQNKDKQLDIVVYDMAGKNILEAKIQEGELVQLPSSSRTGMYLVYITSENSRIPSVGKIIKTSAEIKF